MKIIAFGASSSKHSINKKFAAYAAKQLGFEGTELLDLSVYTTLPIYGIDLEREQGIPQAARDFVGKLEEADLLIISVAEHNGSYTAAFKNLFDWASRAKLRMFEKKMLLLSTGTGSRGGLTVIETALSRFPRHGADIIAHFSLPNFNENFSEPHGITNAELKQKFMAAIETVKSHYVKH